MTYPYAQSVMWISRTPTGAIDDYGNDMFNEAEPVPTPAVYAPAGSVELTGARDTVITKPILYGIDPSMPVKAIDLFVVGGDRIEVDGEPQVYPPNPFSGWQVGQVVQLGKVIG